MLYSGMGTNCYRACGMRSITSERGECPLMQIKLIVVDYNDQYLITRHSYFYNLPESSCNKWILLSIDDVDHRYEIYRKFGGHSMQICTLYNSGDSKIA